MKTTTIYDIAGVGIGPFNLGLAALANPIKDMKSIFFDARPSFSWHPGMMLDFAKLQVPFYADLVTGADPASPFSFLSYMKQIGRLFQFAILEDNYITRREYNGYCLWVASQLDNLYFDHKVTEITYDNVAHVFEVQTASADGSMKIFRARNIVLGIGSVPFIPDMTNVNTSATFFHSAQYMEHREALLKKKSVVIVGSGQSAAEIFYDLLQQKNPGPKKLEWVTRADRLFPMDTSKFSLEMTSPDYIDYFHGLPTAARKHKLRRQDMLYKGINQELLTEIYRLLYNDNGKEISIRTNCELKGLGSKRSGYNLYFNQIEQQRELAITSDAIVMATGYHRPHPTFIEKIKGRIQWDGDEFAVNRNYSIDKNKWEIFVQNADLHSHGFNAPDLGMGTYRNAIILNTVLGYDHFLVEKNIAFQKFGV